MIPVSNFIHNLRLDVQDFIPGSRVLLFGSRAKGNLEVGNDIDLLVISPEDVTPRQKIEAESKIHKHLVWKYNYPFDVLLYSQSEVERKKSEKSLVLYHALKDGIEL